HAEHDRIAESFKWFSIEGKSEVESLHKRARPIVFSTNSTKRADGDHLMATAYFVFPQLPRDRVVMGGAIFDPVYLKQTFFPAMLEESVNQKITDQGGNRIAMMICPADFEMGHEMKPIAASAGWGEGKPEITRKFEDVFRGLALGIKYQGISVE